MKNLLLILILGIVSPVFADDWLGISTQEFQKRISESKIIVVLHWNADISDYQADQIKGNLIRAVFLKSFKTWKEKYSEFRTNPDLIFLFIEKDEIKDDFYIGRSWATPALDKVVDEKEAMHVSEALRLLKEKKNGA